MRTFEINKWNKIDSSRMRTAPTCQPTGGVGGYGPGAQFPGGTVLGGYAPATRCEQTHVKTLPSHRR